MVSDAARHFVYHADIIDEYAMESRKIPKIAPAEITLG